MKGIRGWLGVAVLGLGMSAGAAWAQGEDVYDLGVMTVLGTEEQQMVLPGSGTRISHEDIRKHSYDDVNRILRRVPGVYLREEDGYGLFPNISLRGVDPGRSQKLTLMEDEVPIAPAVYSAPAAYFSPAAGRMHGLEVLKGSSQVEYGPHITGGVVNYISTPIPKEESIYLKGLFGTDSEQRLHGYAGNTVETQWGKVGYLFENYYRETDGFKKIDTTPDFFNGDDTGFDRNEPMVKMSWESSDDAATYQKLEGKFGYTDLNANESYLGLAETELDGDLYRRYAASRFDNMDSDEARTHLRYSREITDNSMLSLTGYYNQFNRNWFKLASVNGRNLSVALAGAGVDLDTLQGEAAGSFVVQNNNRKYEQWGYQGKMNVELFTGDLAHDLEIGVGLHNDQVYRLQDRITYTQDANGVITGSSTSVAGAAGNRLEESMALTGFVRDAITLDRWTFTPGIRYEWIDYEYTDYNTSGTPDLVTGEGSSDLSVAAGGLGVSYAVNDGVTVFGGMHQGYSVPGARDNARSGLKEETSLTSEVGVRYQHPSAFFSELTLFHTDFDNLLVHDNIGGGGGGDTENVGDVISQGVEWTMQYDLAQAQGRSYHNPYYVTFTYTNAELDGDANSSDPESIFSGGMDGNDVPYIPEYQLTLGTGVEFEHWGLFVDGTYVAETFTTADNVSNPYEKSGTPDARFGKTDEFFVVDLSGYYQLNANTRFVANVYNVMDLEYIVSRHPHGPRPGQPFTALAGLEIAF